MTAGIQSTCVSSGNKPECSCQYSNRNGPSPPMTLRNLRLLCAVLICLVLWQVIARAQEPEAGRNLTACRNGFSSCNLSALSVSEANEVAAAEHRRNVIDCRNGWQSCDRSKLTSTEASALAVAAHHRNVSDCMEGWEACDHSKLTPHEARATAIAEHERNIDNCERGYTPCDRSKLTF